MKRILLTALFTVAALFVFGQINDSGILRLLKARQQLKGLDKQELQLKQDLKLLEKSVFPQSQTPRDATTKQKLDSTVMFVASSDLLGWDKSSKDQYIYDAGGKWITGIYYDWNNATKAWVNATKDDYTYNANGKWSVATSYKWNSTNSVWDKDAKQEFTYNAGGYATQILYYDWSTTALDWAKDTKFVLNYNADNTAKEFIVSSWSTNINDWVNSVKYEYIYTNGKLTRVLVSSWDTDVNGWTAAMKYEYEYGTDGKVTRDTYSIWAGTDWMFMMKYEYTYDTNGRTATEIRSDWNFAITNWLTVSKAELMYDANGNNTEYYTYKWESNQWVKQTKEITNFNLSYTYADLILPSGYSVFFSPYNYVSTTGGLNMPLQDIEYAWNAGTANWDNKTKDIYYYSAGSGTGVAEQKADDVSAITIYPNPVTNSFNLNTSESNVQISIFDLSGSLLLSKQISGSDLVDVSFLSEGIYMAKIVTEKATVTRKFVKR
jgi:hypothetical protein